MFVVERSQKLPSFMNDLKMLFSNGRFALERIVGWSPDPDSILADAGNQRVVNQAAKTFNKPNRSAAAECDHWPITVLYRLAIVLSDLQKGWSVDWCVRLRRQATVDIADDQVILRCCSKRHDGLSCCVRGIGVLPKKETPTVRMILVATTERFGD